MIRAIPNAAERIIAMANQGLIEVRELESDRPEIWTQRPGRKPRKLTVRRMTEGRRRQSRLFVDLRISPTEKVKILYNRLIWILATRHVIPEGWEIHHRDEDWESSNAFKNLLCLHPDDHKKFHTSNDPIPF